jgi:hypothetical protein
VNRLKAGVTVAAKVICCRKFFQGRTMLFERNQLLGIIVWCVKEFLHSGNVGKCRGQKGRQE